MWKMLGLLVARTVALNLFSFRFIKIPDFTEDKFRANCCMKQFVYVSDVNTFGDYVSAKQIVENFWQQLLNPRYFCTYKRLKRLKMYIIHIIRYLGFISVIQSFKSNLSKCKQNLNHLNR